MKVLIIKLGALGDIISATPIVNQILKHHASDNVTMLTTSAFTYLFSNVRDININAFERKGFFNTIKAILWIRKQKFDRLYDLQSNDRTTILCALSGIPFRIGNHPRYPYHAHPTNKYIGQCHTFDRLNQIIESAGITSAEPIPCLPVPANIVKDIAEWIKQHDLIDAPFAILHAGSSASHLDKRWPYFKELAIELSKSIKIVWIGSNDDITLNKYLSEKIGINATNVFSIAGLVEFGKYARFAVTNDSAPMHILSCSNIPVFGIFGPTCPRRTHALGQLHNVITPDHHIAINDNDFKPLNIANIKIDAVLQKLNKQNLI